MDRPTQQRRERAACTALGMKHDGRSGAPDCIGKGRSRAEIKDYQRPLQPHDLRSIRGKESYRGARLTVAAVRGGWTGSAASTAQRLNIRLASIEVEDGGGDESRIPPMLVGGGLGVLVGSAFDKPGQHEGKVLGGLFGVLLVALASSP